MRENSERANQNQKTTPFPPIPFYPIYTLPPSNPSYHPLSHSFNRAPIDKASTPQESIINNNNTSTARTLSKDLSKAVISQLAIFTTTLNDSNWSTTLKQIQYLLNKHPQVYPSFLRRIITTIAADVSSDSTFASTSVTAKLVTQQIGVLTLTEPKKVKVIIESLTTPDCELAHIFTLKQLFHFCKLSAYQQILIGLAIESYCDSSFQFLFDQLPALYLQSLPGVVQWIYSKNNKHQDSFSVFLDLFLKSKIFSLPQKLVVIGHINEHIKSESSITGVKHITKSINSYYESISKMSFRDTLLQIGANKLLPDRILTTLISIQQPNQLDDAVSLILSEILYPGSQQLSGNPSNPLTSLTPLSIPEATARGAQMGNMLQQLQTQPNWATVFTKVLANFNATSVITTASLSQFLSSLKTDDRVDSFLVAATNSNDSRLLKSILIQLNSLDPNAGSIDLFELKLTPILESETNTRHLLLYYKSIVKLEVKTVALLQSENSNEVTVNQIFNRDYRAAPEYIALACLHILHETPNAKESDVIVNIKQNFIVSLLDVNSPYLSSIFTKFEEFDAPGLGKLLVQYYEVRKSPESLHKIASLTASFKTDTVIMSILSNAADFPEAFSIAVTFSQYGWKNFQTFVSNQLNRNITIVARTIIDFLENQASIEYENAQQGRRLMKSLNLETVYFLMTSLGSKKQFPAELFDRFKNLQALCLQAYPRLINFGQGHDAAILMNSATNTFSVDVEKEMKVYYQKMYNNEIEIKDIVHMLQRLKVSDNPHDQDVFACMIHSLLDEYRFFPEYPLEALATTSVLFGNTIYFRLVEGPALSIALRYILESARQPPQSKMFKFAVQALYSFTKRLPEFPKFCAMMTEIPALQTLPALPGQATLFETCQSVVQGTLRPSESPVSQKASIVGSDAGSEAKEDTTASSSFVSLSPLNVTSTVAQENPTNEVSDRALFMVNNITEGNLKARATEMKELLVPKYYKWFSQYLVSQRAKLEPNNQALYADLVHELESPVFDTHVLSITLQQIIQLFNKASAGGDDVDPEDVLSTSERAHLKNLGSWLGRVTLPRNLPIQRKHISLKGLLLEAFDHNKLSIVIPFVCKILDQTKESKVFKHPNPWTVGVLQVLKELYEVANLKLSLKFELEVNWNNLLNLKRPLST
ncbi:unnamed protein product [Ambrosiozyma monospora]|uniref:Unnamed protein product n=1 Tax=Ambrosiozyma monospora TaxID=43982 RepID=A0ACB5SSF2_AMBMO|nr:unnamed protein product [Ambrosiozyma monospora]